LLIGGCVTGSPALAPVNTSSGKKMDVAARGRGSYFDHRMSKNTDKSLIKSLIKYCIMP